VDFYKVSKNPSADLTVILSLSFDERYFQGKQGLSVSFFKDRPENKDEYYSS
jgi:hypothetical protein